jgi:hypothetical protein
MENFVSKAGATSLTKGDEKGNTAVHYAVGQPELLDKILLRATELGKGLVINLEGGGMVQMRYTML